MRPRPRKYLATLKKIFGQPVLESWLTPCLLYPKLLKRWFNISFNNQFGFVRDVQLDIIKREVDEGKLVGWVFIDLTKTFQTLNHGAPLKTLKSYGVKNTEFHWFLKFFNRSHQVQYKECLSAIGRVTSGVPQRSILGPLLSIVFLNL